MNYDACVVRFESMEWESPADRFRQKVRELQGGRIRLVEYLRGMEHPEWCTKGHAGYVLEGRLILEFDGGPVELAPGDGLIIPAGTDYRHRPKPATDRVALVLFEGGQL